ncbi:MAG: ATP-binding cassette domain-containing protein [Bacteroidales bacterium]|nr:ATP-binding cassette domain-containing protein [Bacteroidales bacterium]
MSEPILRALMQLFALISDIRSVSEISKRERDIVKSFLEQLLSSQQVGRYMKMFDDYLELYSATGTEETGMGGDIAAAKGIRIKKICAGINEELRQKQKIYIVIQLIDFISYGEEITENELDFLMTVALALNIPENEYKNIKSFIIDPLSKIPEKEKLLIINNKQAGYYKRARHMFMANIPGELIFLNIVSAKTFIFRYLGHEDLYLNGQRIYPRQTYLFDNGSTIKGHGIKTIYYTELFGIFNESRHKARVSLTAQDVVYKFRDSDNGIQNFNFHGESGQLVGIMGVSGTGKSTLLDLLNGNLKPQSGEIFINGYNLNIPAERSRLEGIIGFVPQDDLLIEELTVFENLYYNARMCLNRFKKNRIRKIVERLLADLDLYDIKDLKVGSPLDKVISGGQRKRINIALELVREPFILFVDEPTSGLSSVDSEIVVNLLKEQTYKGKLVIVNIHQPCSDLYKLFDKIIILDKGGYQIYYGNPNEAIIYFKKLSRHANAEEDQCTKCGNINTEQVLQIVEAKIMDERGKLTQTRKVAPEEWYARFREKISSKMPVDLPEKEELPENYYSIPGLFRQMKIFFLRDILSKMANRQYIIISLLGAPLLALILGYFTRYIKEGTYLFSQNENLPAYLFMCVITALFLGLMISAEEIIRDRKILKRESFLNLSWFSYLNSKIVILFAISAIQSLSFILVGNQILGIKGMTFTYWLVLFTTSCSANVLGLNISSAFKSVITVYILLPFILIPQLLLSGVLVKFDKLHRGRYSTDQFVPVIGDLMTARWSFEALAVEQFKNNRYQKNFFEHDMEASQNYYYASFMIDVLKKDLRECLKPDADLKEAEVKCRRLKNYIEMLSESAGYETPEFIVSRLNKDDLDPETARQVESYLDLLARDFRALSRSASERKDQVSASIEREIGREGMIALRDNYYNERLADILLNNEVIDKTLETPEVIIQKYEPAFMKPTSGYGRAHYYAPYKKIGNLKIDTYLFNLTVIWIVTLILYVALYYNLLRKLVTGFSRIEFRESDT